MEKILKWCSVALIGALVSMGVIGTLVVPVMATDIDPKVQPRSEYSAENNTKVEIPPTFATEVDESGENALLWVGKNLFIAGNNIKAETDAAEGLLFAAGNTLEFGSKSEYGFLAGNIINYTGETSRDLFIAGNYITLKQGARIGRDVYTASDTLVVETDLAGDLSSTTSTVELRDVKIAGNVNLTADNIKFTGDVEVAGALVYNETAEVSGLEHVQYGSIEVYEVVEVSAASRIAAAIYGKVVSVAALFITMAIIGAIYSKLHDKVTTEIDVNRFGIDLALGFGALLLIPMIAFFAIISFVAAPLGLILLALYIVMIYLAQGFAGIWLGHLIIEKGFKSKGNIFAEAFIGILLLGLLALIPYIGVITGFLGLLLGLGLILQCIKPSKDQASKIEAKPNSKKAEK